MLRHQQTIETTPKFSNHHGRTISPSMNQQCFGDGQEMSVSKLDVFFSVYVFLPKILRSLNLLLHISLHPSKKKGRKQLPIFGKWSTCVKFWFLKLDQVIQTGP
jgi:hypothetical protein